MGRAEDRRERRGHEAKATRWQLTMRPFRSTDPELLGEQAGARLRRRGRSDSAQVEVRATGSQHAARRSMCCSRFATFPGCRCAALSPTPRANGATIVRVGGNIRPPAKVRDVQAGLSGCRVKPQTFRESVILDAHVGVDGSVVEAQVLRSIPLLDDAAVGGCPSVAVCADSPQWRARRSHGHGDGQLQPVTPSLSGLEGYRG